MAVSDVQLARVLILTIRLVNGTRDEVLSEVGLTPVLSPDEVDAALDTHRILDSVFESGRGDSASLVTQEQEPAGEARTRGGIRGRLRPPAALGLGRDALSARIEKVTAQPSVARTLVSVRGELYPGHRSWSASPVEERVEWWTDRLGTLMAATAAVPGLTGRGAKLTRTVPLLGSAAQMVAICAVARECAVNDEGRIARVIGSVVFNRSLSETTIRKVTAAPLPRPQLEEFDSQELFRLRRLGSAGQAVRQIRVVRTVTGYLKDLDSLLDERPQGNWFVRHLTNLPVAGAAATFYSERAGIRHATAESLKFLR